MIHDATISHESMVAAIREQFPILQRTVHGSKPLVYLDNAATTQKPQCVIDAISNFYTYSNSNVHRAGHTLAAESTQLFENARNVIAKFINADPMGVVFTRSATDSINTLAGAIERKYGSTLSGRTIVVSELEHHANIVPWQLLCERTGAVLRVIGVNEEGTLDLQQARELINNDCAVVSITHMSNVLGAKVDVRTMCSWAREQGAISIVDGSQYVVHHAVDVQDIGCDAYVFSGHKLYGPLGIGVMYGRPSFLESLPPYQGGGAMISKVSFSGTRFMEPPLRFEAGTPNIEGAVGLGVAVEWLDTLNRNALAEFEYRIAKHVRTQLSAIPGMRLLGGQGTDSAIISFVIDGVHMQDVGVLLDEQGVAARTGHHCAMPLLERFGVSTTLRVSMAVYTNTSDADAFVHAIHKSLRLLG